MTGPAGHQPSISTSRGYKVIINENVNFTDYASGIWLPDCSKLAVNWKNGNDATVFWYDVIVNFFSVVLFLLRSLVTGPYFISMTIYVMTNSFYKGFTRNPETWVLPNIWRLGRVKNTKFSTNVSNKMLLNAAKCQGYSFYRF